jgi:hypothetical protein
MKEDLISELHKICDAAGGQHKFENCVEKALKIAKIDAGFKYIYAQAFHLDFRL